MQRITWPVLAAWLFAAGCAAIGMWIVLSATSVYGAGVSSDSMFYISSAENLVKGQGVYDFKGDPMIDFPPLYPMILALLSGPSGITPFVWGRFLNAGTTAAIILSTALLFKQCFSIRRLWFFLGTLATLALVSFYPLATTISTDMLYILFSVWFGLLGLAFLSTRKVGWLIAMTVLAAAASLLRWVGLALAVTEFLLIWVAFRENKRKALAQSVLFGGMAALPMILWAVVRNQLIYGWNGRSPGEVDMLRNLQLSFQRILEWTSPNPAADCLPVAAVLLVLVLALNLWRSGRQHLTSWLRRLFSPAILPTLLLALVYFTAILISAYTNDHLQPSDDRYQLPLFSAILFFLFSGLDELVLSHLNRPVKASAQLVVIAVFAWWGAYQLSQIDQFIRTAREQGVVEYNDYNHKKLVRSGLVVYLIKNPPEPGMTLYSNEPEAVYFFLHRTTKMSPTDPDHYSAEEQVLLPRYTNWPPEEKAYIIWFKPNIKRHYYSPENLKQLVDMEKLYKNWDGELYQIRPKK